MGHKYAKFQLDPKNLSAFSVRDHASAGPWSDDQELDVAKLFYQDHVPMNLGGTDRRTIARSSTMRNGFYIRRVRQSFLSDNAHASAPHVSDLAHMREHLGDHLPVADRMSPAREHQRMRLLPQHSTRDQKKLLSSCSIAKYAPETEKIFHAKVKPS